MTRYKVKVVFKETFICGEIVDMCHICFTAAVSQAKSDPFKKEGSKKEAEDKASSNKSSDKRSSTGIKLTNKWVTKKMSKKGSPCLIFKAHLTFCSLHAEHRHLTKKKTRNWINFQKRTKIYPRNRRPNVENLSPFHLDKILQ